MRVCQAKESGVNLFRFEFSKTLSVPVRGQREAVVVVDGDLLPRGDWPHSQQSNHVAEPDVTIWEVSRSLIFIPRVVHAPPPNIRGERVVAFVRQCDTILVKTEHKTLRKHLMVFTYEVTFSYFLEYRCQTLSWSALCNQTSLHQYQGLHGSLMNQSLMV